MKLLELEINGFMAIEKAKIKLDDRGLVVIQGVNKDDTSAESNGSGKSSLADAIDWVLYGETARGISGDDVVNNTLKKGTRVALTVQDGPSVYTIARHRKHKEFKNSLRLTMDDGFVEKDLTKGTDKLTQEEVLKIVGSSHSVFRASIYSGQEQMPDLPAMTDKNLKLLIEEAAGTSVLEEAYKLARENVLLINSQVSSTKNFIEGLERGAGFKKEEIENHKRSSADFETNRKTQIADLRSRAGDTIKQAGDLMTKMNAILDEATLAAAISAEDAKIAAVDGERKEAGRLHGEVLQKEGDLRAWRRQLEQVELQIKHAEKGLADADHQIGCPCSSCGRPLTEAEMADVKASINKSLTDLRKHRDDTQAKILEISQELADAQKAFHDYSAGMTDISHVTTVRAGLLQEQAKFNQLKSERESVLRVAQSLKDQIETISKGVNPFLASIETAKRQLESLNADIAAKKAELADLEEQALVEAEVVKVFSPAGVRAHILDEVTPYLNAQTSAYLTTLSDGNIEATWSTVQYNAKGEAKERFAIDVSKTKGSAKFGGLSGGEKRKVRLATAMALQDLVATRATKPISLFIADEIDDAIDKAGLERLMNILQEKAKERGSVFIISHNDLADWCSQSIVVTMDGGLATVEEVTD